MIGALYKPAQQATSARSDKLGGQGHSSPTLSSGGVVNYLVPSLLLFHHIVINIGSSPSTVNCVIIGQHQLDYYYYYHHQIHLLRNTPSLHLSLKLH